MRLRVFFLWFMSACMLLLFSWRHAVQAEDLADFTLRDFKTGQPVSTAAYRGKCMLIIFGSMYCRPCVEMLPVIRRLKEQYEAAGLIVIAIDIDVSSEDDKIRVFIEDHQIRHLYLIDTIKVAKQNKVFTLPTTLIVNQKGGIEKRLMGFQDYEKIEKIIKPVLPVVTSASSSVQSQ